jgi:hypothetical protein
MARRKNTISYSHSKVLRSTNNREIPTLREVKETRSTTTKADNINENNKSKDNSDNNIPFSSYEDMTVSLLKRLEGATDPEQSENCKKIVSNKLDDELAFDILEILEGLEIIHLPGIQSGYQWSGIDTIKIKKALTEILDGHNKLPESKSWKGFCEVIPHLIQARESSRIYLRENDKNQKSLKASLAVLKSLKLVNLPKDFLGGAIWIGEDVFEEWDRQQVEKYSNSKVQLKQGKLVLKRCKIVGESNLNQVLLKAEKFKFAEIPTPKPKTQEICKCRNGSVLKRHQKRRTRCLKCVGCLAKKCNKCKYCRNPKWKQSCEVRVCVTPAMPKCPCFKNRK